MPFSLTRADKLFLSLLLILGAFLMWRASLPQRWSDWAFGDAQTMMAVDHWEGEGFLNTHFLWIPQGYSSVSELFDRPELNHHAHGIAAPISKLELSKRMYTHYPSWYAVPLAMGFSPIAIPWRRCPPRG